MTRTLIIAMTLLWAISAAPLRAAEIPLHCPSEEARAMLDTIPLTRIEGIWLFTDDKVEALILRDPASTSAAPSYSITVLNDPSRRLRPGEVVGTIFTTPVSNEFAIDLKSKRVLTYLAGQLKLKCKLSENDCALTLYPPKIHIDLQPFSFLPSLFRRLLTIKVRRAEEPPSGLIRIYPTYDENGSSHLSPRYL